MLRKQLHSVGQRHIYCLNTVIVCFVRCWMNAADEIINATYFYPPIVTSAVSTVFIGSLFYLPFVLTFTNCFYRKQVWSRQLIWKLYFLSSFTIESSELFYFIIMFSTTSHARQSGALNSILKWPTAGLKG